MPSEEQIAKDKAFIEDIGGAPRLIRLMKLEGSRQILCNRINLWKVRGIPAKYKLEYPEIFLNKKLVARIKNIE